jgi:hypothetical protein
VIEAWAAQVGGEALPPGIADLGKALREGVLSPTRVE